MAQQVNEKECCFYNLLDYIKKATFFIKAGTYVRLIL